MLLSIMVINPPCMGAYCTYGHFQHVMASKISLYMFLCQESFSLEIYVSCTNISNEGLSLKMVLRCLQFHVRHVMGSENWGGCVCCGGGRGGGGKG